jgi:hypothetical protein
VDTVKEMRRNQFPKIVPDQGLNDGLGVIVPTNGDWRRANGGWPLQRIVARIFRGYPGGP